MNKLPNSLEIEKEEIHNTIRPPGRGRPPEWDWLGEMKVGESIFKPNGKFYNASTSNMAKTLKLWGGKYNMVFKARKLDVHGAQYRKVMNTCKSCNEKYAKEVEECECGGTEFEKRSWLGCRIFRVK